MNNAIVQRYLAGYAPPLVQQVQEWVESDTLAHWLRRKYPQAHTLRTDAALYRHVMALKNAFMRSSSPLSKAVYDPQLQVLRHALGTHTRVSRVQGSKLKAKKEIRIAAMFKTVPLPLLNMICVHELAHLREPEHNKAFYQLCHHMEPGYAQLELDLRLVLIQQDLQAPPLWPPGAAPQPQAARPSISPDFVA